MHEDYKNVGDPFECLKEECAELIKELCKLTRFGYYSYHPDDLHRTPNWERVLEEIKDVEHKIGEVKTLMEVNRRLNATGN